MVLTHGDSGKIRRAVSHQLTEERRGREGNRRKTGTSWITAQHCLTILRTECVQVCGQCNPSQAAVAVSAKAKSFWSGFGPRLLDPHEIPSQQGGHHFSSAFKRFLSAMLQREQGLLFRLEAKVLINSSPSLPKKKTNPQTMASSLSS